MKCAEVKNWLGALADGEIREPARRQALEAHLRECSACREEYAVQLEIKRLLRDVERARPSPYLAPRVRAAIGARRKPPFRALQLAYVAAMLLAAVVITGGLLAGFQYVSRRPAVSGLFKELPATSSAPAPRMLAREAAMPASDSASPSSFVQFVEAEHSQALELLRAHTQWADDMEALLALISQDEMVDEETHLKELPPENAAENRHKQR